MKNQQLTFVDMGISIEPIPPQKTKQISRSSLPEGSISGSKAMEMLELSRHVFDKLVKEGNLTQHVEGKKKYYLISELKAFMETEKYQQLVPGSAPDTLSANLPISSFTSEKVETGGKPV